MTVADRPATDHPATYRQVLAVPEFRTLLGGFALFLVGETVQMLALSVLVYAGTGSPLLAALAYVAGFLPQALGGTVLLAVADRWRPRRVLPAFDLLRLGVAVLLAAGVLPPVAMVLLVFVLGVLAPVANATRTALLPDLLDGDRYVLGRSMFTVVSAGMQVAGAAVGGLLIALTGAAGALWLTAAGCVVSAAVHRFGLTDRPARSPFRSGPDSPRRPEDQAPVAAQPRRGPGSPRRPADQAPVAAQPRGTVRDTWRVNRLLLADPAIRGLLLAQWLPGVLMVAAEGVVVPYAAGLDRAAAAGALLGAAAGGLLLGEFVTGRFVPPRRRERLTPWLALLLGVPLLGFLLRPGVVPGAILLGCAAAGFAYQLGLARRFLDALPVAHRGQAFGLAMTGTMTLQGLSMAGAGALAEVLPPGTVMALAGAASITATVVLWPRLRAR